MIEDSIEILTRMFIEEHFKGTDKQKYVINKQELYQFCIKLLKVLEENKYEN